MNQIMALVRGPGGLDQNRPTTIIEGFTAIRDADPSAAAMWADGRTWTYAELDAAAGRLHAAIASYVRGPDTIVALALPRSAEMVIAMLATLRAGAAYLPLDPATPPGRVGFMLAHSRASLLIVGDEITVPADVAIPRLAMNDPRVARHPRPDAPVPQDLAPDDLAYVMFTSGSTGVPKAVAVTHANVVSFAWRPDFLDITPGTRMLHLSTTVFDAATLEIWGTLLNGACLVVAPDGPADPVALERLLRDQAVDIANVTTGLMSHMAAVRPGLFRSLKTLLVSGDVLPPNAVRAVRVAAPAVAVINGYGPTETTVFATIHRVTAADLAEDRLPIGRPFGGVQIHILDANGAPVADGEAGEIFIAGSGVARGYLHDPERTAERYVPCPFGPADGRMYRSGDIGRRRADGAIDFLGRADQQIKLRGFRIEPAEIEAALLAADDRVAQAVVIARDIQGRRQLIGYAVPRHAGAPPEIAALKAHLAAALPAYMVPATIICLPSLPLNLNGKIDRAALPSPATRRGGGAQPRNSTETILCRLFAELTGAADIGREDDFFALGGDSLAAMQLVIRYQEATGTSLPLATIFRHPEVAALAAASADAAVAEWSPLLPLRASGTEKPLFCVHPATGIAAGFATLAAALPPTRPVWGLQAREVVSGDAPRASIPDMAGSYVAAIRKIQPHGPYALLGWSLGGVIAQEMACQIEASGETVALLVLLDAGLPQAGALDVGDDQSAARDMLVRMSHRTDAASRAHRARLLHQFSVARGYVSEDAPAEWAEQMLRQVASVTPILQAHLPRLCRAPTLMVSAQRVCLATDEMYDWRPYVGGMETMHLPAPHSAMLHPDMAARIAAAIAKRLP